MYITTQALSLLRTYEAKAGESAFTLGGPVIYFLKWPGDQFPGGELF